MSNLTKEFKERVIQALFQNKENFEGTEKRYAEKFGIHPSVYSRLKKGESEGLLSDNQYVNIGRILRVNITNEVWNIARNRVFELIEEEFRYCKELSKSRIIVDEPDIGKSETVRYLASTTKNTFYIDASQCVTKNEFVRELARVLGVESGKYAVMKANIKFYLRNIQQAMVVIDEAGDLEYPAFLVIKEMWNATENYCGWLLLGADGLEEKLTRGIKNRQVGYREIFSRFSGKYTRIVPRGLNEKITFYREIISAGLEANHATEDEKSEILKRCLVVDSQGNVGGMRRAKNMLIYMRNENSKHSQLTK